MVPPPDPQQHTQQLLQRAKSPPRTKLEIKEALIDSRQASTSSPPAESEPTHEHDDHEHITHEKPTQEKHEKARTPEVERPSTSSQEDALYIEESPPIIEKVEFVDRREPVPSSSAESTVSSTPEEKTIEKSETKKVEGTAPVQEEEVEVDDWQEVKTKKQKKVKVQNNGHVTRRASESHAKKGSKQQAADLDFQFDDEIECHKMSSGKWEE